MRNCADADLAIADRRYQLSKIILILMEIVDAVMVSSEVWPLSWPLVNKLRRMLLTHTHKVLLNSGLTLPSNTL